MKPTSLCSLVYVLVDALAVLAIFTENHRLDSQEVTKAPPVSIIFSHVVVVINQVNWASSSMAVVFSQQLVTESSRVRVRDFDVRPVLRRTGWGPRRRSTHQEGCSEKSREGRHVRNILCLFIGTRSASWWGGYWCDVAHWKHDRGRQTAPGTTKDWRESRSLPARSHEQWQ